MTGITLLCLVRGDSAKFAFAIDIDKNKLIYHLKEPIKEKRPDVFSNVNANDLCLWNAPPLEQLVLEDNDELLPVCDITDYFAE